MIRREIACVVMISIVLVMIVSANMKRGYGTFVFASDSFEHFPFSLGDRSSCLWDWVDGYQVDASGVIYPYGDYGNDSNVYIRQSTEHVRDGNYSAEFHIDAGEAQHCKLYEANQDRYPSSYYDADQPEAYYSVWYWFPNDFASTIGDWRLLMQWADIMAAGTDHFPTLYLNFETWDGSNLGLKLCNDNWWRDGSGGNSKRDTGVTAYSIPKEQWVHIVVYVKMSSSFRAVDGKAIVWINDQKVIDCNIALWNYYSSSAGAKGVCWGIGNYGTATAPSSIWIDDVEVTGELVLSSPIQLKDFLLAYGSTPNSPNWNPNADLNNDGRVDLKDYYTACLNSGK